MRSGDIVSERVPAELPCGGICLIATMIAMILITHVTFLLMATSPSSCGCHVLIVTCVPDCTLCRNVIEKLQQIPDQELQSNQDGEGQGLKIHKQNLILLWNKRGAREGL
jgi:hypothetical protein